jgi:hypothetical protein
VHSSLPSRLVGLEVGGLGKEEGGFFNVGVQVHDAFIPHWVSRFAPRSFRVPFHRGQPPFLLEMQSIVVGSSQNPLGFLPYAAHAPFPMPALCRAAVSTLGDESHDLQRLYNGG